MSLADAYTATKAAIATSPRALPKSSLVLLRKSGRIPLRIRGESREGFSRRVKNVTWSARSTQRRIESAHESTKGG